MSKTQHVRAAPYGDADFMGTTIIGAIRKCGLYGVLIGISVLMAILALMLIPLSGWLWPVARLLALWSLVATAAPVGWWSWRPMLRDHTG